MLSLLSCACLLSTAWPLWLLWRSMSRTALRSACVWAGLAAGVWAVVAGMAVLEREPGDWIELGLLRLLSSGLLLAPIVAVFGARRPGEAAWNLIVLGLLVVFTLPVLEQWLLGKQLETDRVGMDGPRFTFYAIVVFVGSVNYLPTRFAPAALLLAMSLGFQITALGPWHIGSVETIAILLAIAAVLASAAVWVGLALSGKSRPAGTEFGMTAAWLRLRDGWGLVWSMRLRNRWNAAAQHYGWNMRLNWNGFAGLNADESLTTQDIASAADQFALLLRRFVDPSLWMPP